LLPAALYQPAFESLKGPPEKVDWLRTPVFGQRVSDNGVLCQNEHDLQVGIEICASDYSPKFENVKAAIAYAAELTAFISL